MPFTRTPAVARKSRIGLVAGGLGAGGSFTGLPALNFRDGVVERGHDGPGLGAYHGKRGWGVSVEFDVRHGPVTLIGLGQTRDGKYKLIASEGRVVEGPLLEIGNTTSCVDFGCDPGEWADAWSASAVAHHRALATGSLLPDLRALVDLSGPELVEVSA
jgi:L-arabinose isomerase